MSLISDYYFQVKTPRIRSRKLLRAWKQFTQAMYSELALREEVGWEGWDDEKACTDRNLMARAKRNLRNFASSLVIPEDGPDAANLIMFVWYRRMKRLEKKP